MVPAPPQMSESNKILINDKNFTFKVSLEIMQNDDHELQFVKGCQHINIWAT